MLLSISFSFFFFFIKKKFINFFFIVQFKFYKSTYIQAAMTCNDVNDNVIYILQALENKILNK